MERKLNKASSLPISLNNSTSTSNNNNNIKNKRNDAKASSGDNSVTVCVRIRPPNPAEIEAGMKSCFTPSDDGDAVIELHDDMITPKIWPYDFVFGAECSNEYVFNATARKLVSSALDGYNTVLFMYGQTSSGKTFTLFGGGKIHGLVDHTLREVYDVVMKSTDTEYVIKMIFVELYNEELKDLLSYDPNQQEKLTIIDDPDLGPLIQGITEVNFTSVERMREHLNDGDRRRHFGVTNMNAHSSRSHVMVRLNIESRKVHTKPDNPLRQSWGKDKPTCFSTLNLVDLAGSERANKSGTSGQSLKEGSFINKSLLTLGTIISNLSEGKLKHVPYRDSKLTRLLSSALGGNAKTCVITCVSPAEGNLSESISTLRFAQRAKNIVNHVKKNEFDDAKSLAQKLAAKQAEIDSLRAELESGGGNGGNNSIFKEKAKIAQRRFRILKFLMINSSTITKSLSKAGKHDLAKRVRDDIRAALEGSKTLEDLLEDHSELMSRHLSEKQNLLRRMSYINRVNSMDILIGDQDDDDDSSTNFSELDGHDLFDSEIYNNDELMEQNESLNMKIEDMRQKYSHIIQKLYQEKIEIQGTEKKYKLMSEELTKKLSLTNDEFKKTKDELSEYRKKYDKLTKQHHEDNHSQSTEIENMKKQLISFEEVIEEKENIIRNNHIEISNKEEDNELLRKKIDQLTKDLHTANSMRDNFEKESKRTREELNKQMERLRSNMSSMLQQGDQESKVLEMQNSLLFNDLKLAQNECESLKFTQSQTEEHMNNLRKELLITQENAKSALIESKELRQTVTKAQQTTQSLQLEITKVKAQLNVYESENERLRINLSEEFKSSQNEIEKLNEIIKSDTLKYKTIIAELNKELSLANAAIIHHQAIAETKESALIKIEQHGHFESLKLEKKLSEQIKLHEDACHEHNITQKRLRDKLSHVLDEINIYKTKLAEQELQIENMNSLIQASGIYESDEDNNYNYNNNEWDDDDDENENENDDNDNIVNQEDYDDYNYENNDSNDSHNNNNDNDSDYNENKKYSYDDQDDDDDDQEDNYNNYNYNSLKNMKNKNKANNYNNNNNKESISPPNHENLIPFTPPFKSAVRKVFLHINDDSTSERDENNSNHNEFSPNYNQSSTTIGTSTKLNSKITPTIGLKTSTKDKDKSQQVIPTLQIVPINLNQYQEYEKIFKNTEVKYKVLKMKLKFLNYITKYYYSKNLLNHKMLLKNNKNLIMKYFDVIKNNNKNVLNLNSNQELKDYYQNLIKKLYSNELSLMEQINKLNEKMKSNLIEKNDLVINEDNLKLKLNEIKEINLNVNIKYNKLLNDYNLLNEEFDQLKKENNQIIQENEENLLNKLLLENENEKLLQINKIIKNERNELMKQFIPNCTYEEDEYGLEILVNKSSFSNSFSTSNYM